MDGRIAFTALLTVYFLFLILGQERQYKLATVLFVLGAAFIAFHAEPIYDLNNYYAGQGYKESLSLQGFWEVFGNQSEVGAQFWMWLWSKFRYLGFLPAMTTAVFYGGVLATLLLVGRKEMVKREYLILALMFVLCTTKYYSVLAGIRNHLGFAIFALSFWGEFLLEKDKKLCWLGYLLSLSFHSSLLLFLILRLFLAIYRRFPNQLMMVVLMIFSTMGYPIIGFLADATGNGYLQGIEDKAEAYYGNGKGESNSLSLGNLSTACIKLLCIIVLLLYAYALYRKGKLPSKYRSYLDYLAIAVVMTLGTLSSQHSLVRFLEFIGLLAGPIVMVVLTYGERIWEGRPTGRQIMLRPKYPRACGWMFLMVSGMFAAFQFLGTWTLIGWQAPALVVGSIR